MAFKNHIDLAAYLVSVEHRTSNAETDGHKLHCDDAYFTVPCCEWIMLIDLVEEIDIWM
jgi:hypothetical protein